MLRVVTNLKTNNTLIVGIRGYCAECETPLETSKTTNGLDFCPRCKHFCLLKDEVLAVPVCPLCNRNVWNFRKSGTFDICPHCKQEFIASADTQPQKRKTTQ